MSPDRLSATFSALADPTRRAILARLASGETTVSELAKPFEMSLPAVTKHLKVLQRAGLISQGRQAQWRPCKLEAQPLKDVSNWVEQYRQFWEQRLDRLEEYLRELQAAEQQASEAAVPAACAQKAEKAAVAPKARGKKK
jgi:DNA-binding transcriptional ArsR family regulator